MKTLSNVWLYSGFLPSLSLSLSPPPGKGKKRDPGNDAVIAVASHFFFCNFPFYTSFSCIAESVPMWYIHTYIWPLPAGLFRASAAQRDRLNLCEGTSDYRQTVTNDPRAQQPSQMLLTWTHDLPHNSPLLNTLSYRCAVLAVLFHLFWLQLCQNHFFFV